MFGKKKPAAPPPAVDAAGVATAVKAFVAKRSKLIAPGDLAADTPLFSSGILDSLAFLDLVIALETALQLSLSRAGASVVNMESMDSIDAITAVVLVQSRSRAG